MRKLSVLLLGFILCYAGMNAAEDETTKIAIDKYLYVGPVQVQLPAFADLPDVDEKKYSRTNLLSEKFVEQKDLWPAHDDLFYSYLTYETKWDYSKIANQGKLDIPTPDNDKENIMLFATYISADRWLKAKLKMETNSMVVCYLNGIKQFDNTNEGDKVDKSSSLELPRGKYLLLVKTLANKETPDDSYVKLWLEVEKPFSDENIEITLDNSKLMNIDNVLNGIKAGSVQLSSNGRMAILSHSKRDEETNKTERWYTIVDVKNGRIVHSFRNAKIGGLRWAPKSFIVSYMKYGTNGNSIMYRDLKMGVEGTILENVEGLSSYMWSNDAKFIVYSKKEKEEKKTDVMTMVRGMEDRQSGWRERYHLYKYDIKFRRHTRLTYGNESCQLHGINPNTKEILFSRSRPNYLRRPYATQDMYLMDLETFAIDTLWIENPYGGNPHYSSNGKYLVVTGASSLFGDIGLNVNKGTMPNDYDTQLYIYNLDKKTAKCVTKDFAPSVNNVIWAEYDKNIYFTATDKDRVKLFRWEILNEMMVEINTGVDIVHSFSLADNLEVLAFSGNSISSPMSVYIMDLKSFQTEYIYHPERENYEDVKFGETMEWNWKKSRNDTVFGRCYLPPDFDPSNKYPMIVYYYGGTSPVSRSFGGRYPFNLYAANGYIVYVLQPTGCTGFGQKKSAVHVNDWGDVTSEEIINATKAFIEEHDYVDKNRVGCMGASYGGFMTMMLMTKTDIFAAAISHAGISSLASYWGEGYWGYTYSAVATANTFPWSDPQYYIDHSPLFHADKVNTPLLLLHGDSDTNVPPGESIQFYTALKMLNKPVELITVKDTDHWVVDYPQRIKWNNTILSWFDMWLKYQPEWWEDMYPEKNY